MGFLDEVVITVRSGDGGKGCVSFRRQRFIPKGGPDGGDGGDGGNVIVRATRRLYTLQDYAYRPSIKAKNGAPGRGKDQSGKKGPDLILEVPLGTIISDDTTGELIADLVEQDQEVIVARGGKGGKGNKHFATATNRAPRFAQPGTPGEEKRLRLSLKFIADIGLIGYPNVGKSTLLSKLTQARPKIDNYPFTTLVPNLGVLYLETDFPVVIADIPGLVEGASAGKGLGHQFLKHIERTRLLIHVLDVNQHVGSDILKDFKVLAQELQKYDPTITTKPRLVLINKMDVYDPEIRDIKRLREELEKLGLESFPVSGLTGQGLDSFIQKLRKIFREQGQP